jgi:pimeloyl-ACP methyl ester carboxylesterase
MNIRSGEPCSVPPNGLSAVYYPAQGPGAGRALLVPPGFDEKRCAHRAMAEMCATLAARGVAALHLDLTGTGNSPGTLAETHLSRWADDLRAAAGLLAERAPGPTSVVGCRLGGLLAAWALAEGALSAEWLLLWQPVTDGGAYLRNARKRRMVQDGISGREAAGDDPYEVEGERVAEPLHRALEALVITALPAPADVRLLQCSFSDRLSRDHDALIKAWGAERVRLRRVIAQPFWYPHTPAGYDEIVAAAADLLTEGPDDD